MNNYFNNEKLNKFTCFNCKDTNHLVSPLDDCFRVECKLLKCSYEAVPSIPQDNAFMLTQRNLKNMLVNKNNKIWRNCYEIKIDCRPVTLKINHLGTNSWCPRRTVNRPTAIKEEIWGYFSIQETTPQSNTFFSSNLHVRLFLNSWTEFSWRSWINVSLNIGSKFFARMTLTDRNQKSKAKYIKTQSDKKQSFIKYEKKKKTFFFLSGFSFTTIHESEDCRGRGRTFLSLLSTTSSRFTLRH